MTGGERCAALPRAGTAAAAHYTLANARVPTGCIQGKIEGEGLSLCIDSLALVDFEIKDGVVAALRAAGGGATTAGLHRVDLHGKMVLPTFADLHTHIGGELIDDT